MKKNYSWPVIYALLLVTTLSLIPLRSLKFEFNIEKLFPSGDPDLALFQEFQHQFQSQIDDEFIFIGLENNEGIFRQDFLTKADSLTRFMSRIPHILKVYSLTSANAIYLKDSTINAHPVIHIYQPEFYHTDSIYLFQSPEYRDLLVSKDGKSIAIAAFNEQNLTDKQKDLVLDGIEKKMGELGFDKTHLTAKIRMERIYIKEIERNLQVYLVVSLALISLTLYLMFRSVKQIIIPLVIIAISLIWTMSLISLTGSSLDIISSLLPPILAAICMSDIIHISTKYIEELRNGLSKEEALKKTYREVGLATFFTCITVAVGFASLSIVNIIPIQKFGLFAAAGIVIGFIVSMLMLHAYFSLSSIPRIVYQKRSDRKWNSFLAFMFRKVISHKYLVLSLAAAVCVASVFFIRKIEINSRVLQEIPKGNPMLDDYRFMEKDFAGTRPFELVLDAGSNRSFFDIDLMRKMEELERFLKDSMGVGYVISPLSLFKGANKAFHSDSNVHFTLPGSQYQVTRFYEGIMQTEHADEMEHYLLKDGSRARISGRLPDLSIKEFKVLEKRFESFFNNNGYGAYFSYHMTGSAVLLDKIVFYLTKNLFTGIWIDAIITALIALFLLRYWRMVFIVLVPNLIPLLIMGAAMGILGIDLKADTSVIFAIAFGIAVDDTIHFLSSVRIALDKGLSLPYAIKRTYLSTGKAIIITTIVLLTGFLTLLSSSFGGAFYIGLLISICLSFAVILDLTVLPVLLLLFYKKKKKLKTGTVS